MYYFVRDDRILIFNMRTTNVFVYPKNRLIPILVFWLKGNRKPDGSYNMHTISRKQTPYNRKCIVFLSLLENKLFPVKVLYKYFKNEELSKGQCIISYKQIYKSNGIM